MLTLTSEYALRALIFIAQHEEADGLISGAVVAEHTGIPAKYLSAVLRELVRNGVLASTRGKGGGFCLAGPADSIPLHVALSSFEPVLSARRPCPFGNEVCSDEDPCAGHDRWKKVRDTYNDFLATTTIEDIATKKRPRRKATRKRRRKSNRRG